MIMAEQYAHKFHLGVPFHTYLEDYAPSGRNLPGCAGTRTVFSRCSSTGARGPANSANRFTAAWWGLALDIQRDPETNVSSSPATGKDFPQ